MIHQVMRRDHGTSNPKVAAAVVQAVAEAAFAGIRFPCHPLIAECYPEGAVVHGSCRHTVFFRLLLLPSSQSIHEPTLTQRWGSRQTVPIQSREDASN